MTEEGGGAPETALKEEFSNAVIELFSAVRGYTTERTRTDLDSIDVTIRCIKSFGKKDLKYPDPALDVQLKATSHPKIAGGYFSYPLPKKNYDDLRKDSTMVPKILIVVIMPENEDERLTCTQDKITATAKAYYFSLKGMEDRKNKKTITIKIPTSNILTPDKLDEIMRTIAKGGDIK